MIIPLFAYNWRFVMLVVTGAPLIISSILMTQLKESPRFLVIKKQFEKARAVINEIAFINGRLMPAKGWVFEDEVRIN